MFHTISGRKENNRDTFRNRRIFYTGLSLLGSRGVNMLVLIATLPLCLNYLGAERFGMMETIIALIMIMSFADFGLGFGLQNRMAQLMASENALEIKRAISSVFYVLLAVVVVFVLIFTIVYPYIPWHRVFNVSSEIAKAEAAPAVLIFFICFAVQIPFSIVRKVQIGVQEGYFSELWTAAGNIAGLLFIILSIRLDGGVPAIIASIYGAKSIALLGSYVFEFYIKRPEFRPSWRYFSLGNYKRIYLDGVVFLGLQISNIVLTSSDRILITHLISPESVAIYSIGMRLVMIFATPLEAFIYPMLPAFNDAMARNESEWLKSTIKKARKYTLVFSLISVVTIILFGNVILFYWIGPKYTLSFWLLVMFAVFVVYSNINFLISNIMLTTQMIKSALLVYVVGVLASVAMKFVLIPSALVSGALIGSITGMSIFYLMPAYAKIRRKQLL